MKGLSLAIIIALCVAAFALGSAVARLENYRYANFLGSCSEYAITDPVQRIKRESCLENTQTRTSWLWHILYGLKLI